MWCRRPVLSVPATPPSSPTRGQGEVGVQHPGQQPDGPAADPQVDVGVAEAGITRQLQGVLVVVGQSSQAGRATARLSSHASTAMVMAGSTSRSTRELVAAGGAKGRRHR